MTLDSESFEVQRWHSPEFVESWMTDETREAWRRTLRKKLVSMLAFEPEATIRVLDVGAGTGGLSLEILGNYPKAHMVCQDFSEAMLAHARQKLKSFSAQVTFVQSDLQDPAWLRLIEGTFDAVVSSLVMHTVPNRTREIYRELLDKVNPGGCLLTGDVFAPPGPILEKAYLKARILAYQATIKAETGVVKSLAEIEQDMKERRRIRESSFPHRVRNRPVGFFTIMNHLEWLRQAGFDEVDCLWKDMHPAIIGGFRRAL